MIDLLRVYTMDREHYLTSIAIAGDVEDLRASSKRSVEGAINFLVTTRY